MTISHWIFQRVKQLLLSESRVRGFTDSGARSTSYTVTVMQLLASSFGRFQQQLQSS